MAESHLELDGQCAAHPEKALLTPAVRVPKLKEAVAKEYEKRE